jgi:hypothetical protein
LEEENEHYGNTSGTCRAPASFECRKGRLRPRGDDLKEVTVQILEIDTAPAVMVTDLALLCLPGVGPVGKLPFADPAEDLVELRFADQEGVVLLGDLTVEFI